MAFLVFFWTLKTLVRMVRIDNNKICTLYISFNKYISDLNQSPLRYNVYNIVQVTLTTHDCEGLSMKVRREMIISFFFVISIRSIYNRPQTNL